VNQLRALLNSNFGQKLPLLSDSSVLLDAKNIDPSLLGNR
jgi:hypothetical protein